MIGTGEVKGSLSVLYRKYCNGMVLLLLTPSRISLEWSRYCLWCRCQLFHVFYSIAQSLSHLKMTNQDLEKVMPLAKNVSIYSDVSHTHQDRHGKERLPRLFKRSKLRLHLWTFWKKVWSQERTSTMLANISNPSLGILTPCQGAIYRPWVARRRGLGDLP